MPEIKLYYNIDRPQTQRRTLYSGEGLTLSAMLLDARCQPVNFDGGAAQLIIDDGTKSCKFWAWPARVDGETISIDFDPAWVGTQKQLLCWFSFVAAGGGRVNRMPLVLDIAYTPILDGTQLPPPTAAYATPAELAEEVAARQSGDATLQASIDATAESVQAEAAARASGDKANEDKIAAVESKADYSYKIASDASSDAATAQRTADKASTAASKAQSDLASLADDLTSLADDHAALAAGLDDRIKAAQSLIYGMLYRSDEDQITIGGRLNVGGALSCGDISTTRVGVTGEVTCGGNLETGGQLIVWGGVITLGQYAITVDTSSGSPVLKVDQP